MTSPESQNKKGISMLSLMKEDLKHRKWMLIVSSVVQAFAGPIVILFMLSALRRSRQYGISDFVTDTDYMYKTVHSLVDNITGEYLPIMQIVVAVVGAIIVGIGGYRHLFNRRMTDMVNSLPVKRGKQFAVIYLNGLLIWFVPFILSLILSITMCVMETARWGFGSLITGRGVGIVFGSILCFLVIYNLIILGVVLAGTIFNALLNILFIGFDLIIGYGVLYLLCDNYFVNFYRLPLGGESILWLSPPIAACFCSYVISVGGELLQEFMSEGIYVFSLVMTIAVTVLNLLLSLIMYSKRKSEEAESGVSNKPYRFLVRTINAIYAGHLTSYLMSELLSIRYGTYSGWRIFFAAFFTVLTYGLIDMFQGRSFKAFFAHWKQMIAVTVVMELILTVFIFDLTGFDNRMVSRGNLNGAEIIYYGSSRNSSGSGYYPVPGQEGYLFGPWYNSSYNRRAFIEVSPELAYDIISADKLYYDSKGNYVYDPVDKETVKRWDYSEQPWDDTPFSENVNIIADRKVGFDHCRSYRIADPDVIDEILNYDGYKEETFKIESGVLGYPESISIEVGSGYNNTEEIPAQFIPMIMEAYYADFEENYSAEYLELPREDITLNLRYRIYYSEDDYKNDEYSTNRFSIQVVKEDTRTMEVIKQLVKNGVIDEYLWFNQYVYIDDIDQFIEDYELYSF